MKAEKVGPRSGEVRQKEEKEKEKGGRLRHDGGRMTPEQNGTSEEERQRMIKKRENKRERKKGIQGKEGKRMGRRKKATLKAPEAEGRRARAKTCRKATLCAFSWEKQ